MEILSNSIDNSSLEPLPYNGENIIESIPVFSFKTGDEYVNGLKAKLSSHRVYWQHNNRWYEIRLNEILSINGISTFFSKFKCKIEYGKFSTNIRLSNPAATDKFIKTLESLKNSRSWSSGTYDIRRMVGVGAALYRQEAVQVNRQQQMSSAASDLSLLKANASSLMQDLKKIVRDVNQSNNSSAETDKEAQEIAGLLSQFGLNGLVGVSAADSDIVTGIQNLCGSIFDLDNARNQLKAAQASNSSVETKLEILGKFVCLVPLPDLFCLFNRVRNSTRLVLPAEFAVACETACKGNTPYRLRQLPDGTKVIELKRSDNDIKFFFQELEQLANCFNGESALGLATLWRKSPKVVMELLLDAEASGFLCRDESREGLRFFPNEFKKLAIKA